MEQLSGYEIAQNRIENRQRKRIGFGAWSILLMLMLGLTLIAGSAAVGCTIPLIVSMSFFAIRDAIELYYASPRRAPSRDTVDDEMVWLFGDDWRDMAEAQEYVLAQERIQRRRIRRSYFYLHLVVFLLVNAGLLYLLIERFTRLNSDSLVWLLLFQSAWLASLAVHGIMALPTRRRLIQYERQFGLALQTEMQQNIPKIAERKEKPKRDVQYRVGEDGELEEIREDFEGEKPKRDLL